MAAFVLGNGVSRRPIDIDRLKQLGDVYACNAVYRTHTVTALVATDRAMATEIQESGYAQQNRFYTRRPISGSGAKSVPQDYFGYSSGPIALALACLDHHSRAYLLGFDLGPNEQGKFNNIFAGSQHYKAAGAAPTYTGNWIRQITKIAEGYPQTEIIRVHGSITAFVPEFDSVPNIKKLDFAEFVARINTAKDL